MSTQPKVLLVHACGHRALNYMQQTLTWGLLRRPRDFVLGPPWNRFKVLRVLLGAVDQYAALGYMQDWRTAFETAPRIRAETVNLTNFVDYAAARRKMREYPLVVVLHAAGGDSMDVLLRTASWFRRRQGRLLVLFGNEFDLMPQRIAFLQRTEADFVGTQLPLAAGRWLYEPAQKTRVLAAPHALNPQVFTPGPAQDRPLDFVFCGAKYNLYIGDRERTTILEHLQQHGAEYGLRCLFHEGTKPQAEWIKLLQSSWGTMGAESGTYFLERTDETIRHVTVFLKENPQASYEEVQEKFFRHYPNPVSGKALSSRHFEAIGAKTCQVLLEGHYNGILQPWEHYIPVKKDLSDIADAIACFKDAAQRRTIVDRAHDFALAHHTYAHRVADLLSQVLGSSV